MKWLLSGLVAVSLWASGLHAESVTLSPDDAYLRAVQALDTGQPKLANAISDALLTRDGTEFRVLVLKSRAARNLGQFDEALDAGQRAWDVSETDAQKFTSAMITAQALASNSQRTRAQIWLRRAAELAPNEGTRRLAVRDFQYVRARNPWAAELKFSVTPTNNINNGSARETTRLYGLPFEFQLSGAAQALSGIEYSSAIAGRYRFDQGPHFAQDLTFQASHRTYTMTSDAKAAAPGVSGSDFAFSQAAVGYTFTGISPDRSGGHALSATAGHTWYGGEAYSAYLRLGGSRSFNISDRSKLTFSASAERQFGIASPDADSLRGDIQYFRRIEGLGILSLSAGNTTSMSATDVAEFSEIRGGVGLKLAKPVLGTSVSFGITVRDRDYTRSAYDPTGRQDREIGARLDLVFKEIEKYGFNPSLSVTSSRTSSNIGLYDIDQTGVKFGFQSAF